LPRRRWAPAAREAFTVEDLRREARRRVPRQIFDFIDGGAGDEVTLRANRTAFDRVTLHPEYLVDVAERRTGVRIGGSDLSLPVLLGPAGLNAVVHRHGELAAARAAGNAGTVYTVSTASSFSIEEIARVATGPLWFQLYLWRDREIIGGLVDRARRNGYTALVLTIDVPIVARRDRDLRNGMAIPPTVRPRAIVDAARRPRWLREYFAGPPLTFKNFVDYGFPVGSSSMGLMAYVNRELSHPGATWGELGWLRDRWAGRLYVKGVLTPEDAVRAFDAGADGIVVSNHGGRQLDGVPASLDVLPAIAAATAGHGEIRSTVVCGGGSTSSGRWRLARMPSSSRARICGVSPWVVRTASRTPSRSSARSSTPPSR
jgi:isopentenyl diphosphate isomerase/L-lactate dehydrogenase-like FMN-dependent dehydrogenase